MAPAVTVYRIPSTILCLSLAVLIGVAAAAKIADAQEPAKRAGAGEPQWIWSAEQAKGGAQPSVCFFRKSFRLGPAERGEVQITCDDAYELFVNGRHVGSGSDWKAMQTYDVLAQLRPGVNVIAVRAENKQPGSAGLVARVTVMQRGNTDVSQSSDGSWKVSTRELLGWEKVSFNDAKWAPARVLGEFGRTAPWGEQVVSGDGSGGGRFAVPEGFFIERVLGPEEAESLIAMTFNEFGGILASREGGPLILISDDDQDSIPETVSVFCDKVKSCQGILALNGLVFAVGEGPEGTGLYKLEDEDHDRLAEKITLIFKFHGGMGEHGPHAPILGPDGMLYLMLGNHTHSLKEVDPRSPHHDYYEGDLVLPKYEDAGGHAIGIKAPCGVVIRTDLDGNNVQMVAGGFRNAYDIAFSREGDLFSYDSDMEWDEGLPWYRPTRAMHVTAGAEFGSRTGWSVWPDYYLDSLPATVDTGRGSPTGIEVYNHVAFPSSYHDALFLCDWARGRIVCAPLRRAGASYTAEAETFLEGRPANVTDIAVGPDGMLYFTTGGRGTEGGVYRIGWSGKVPPQPTLIGIGKAIRQPQLYSAWGRQRIANVKEEMGAQWDTELVAVLDGKQNPAPDRTRALDLMQLYGPTPTPEYLVSFQNDPQPLVRAKVAALMALHSSPSTAEALVAMLSDPDAGVRRVACESLVRAGHEMPVERLIELAGEPDRYLAWAARRALEQVPAETWEDQVLASEKPRVFMVGATGLLVAYPNEARAKAILDRSAELMKGYLSDTDFLDLLRLMQLAMVRGPVDKDQVPALRKQLAEEYPSADVRMNRELVRLMAYLDEPSVLPRMVDQLDSDLPLPEKIHIAFYLRFMQSGWTADQKLRLLAFLEQARVQPGGHSYPLYFENVSRDFFANFDDAQRQQVLAEGSRWPGAALSVLATLPERPSREILDQLIALDEQLRESADPSARRLGTGIVAVLGRSGDPQGMAYLRERFEEDPERRQELAMGLAQQPGGENFALLLRVLPIVEGGVAREVINKLASTDQKPEGPEPIRQVIVSGLKLGENGAEDADRLLAQWTDRALPASLSSWDAKMKAWQDWFVEEYPDQPPATLPVEAGDTRWTYDELVEFLASDNAHGEAKRGFAVFEKGQCVKCHRFGDRGEGIGPDLTTVSQRFQKKEVVQSVVFPSQVISDQYASKTVETASGRTFSGIVSDAGARGIIILQSNGEKVTIPKNDIENISPNSKSAMPEGLFNELTLDEIADLFAYLYSRGPVQAASRR